MSRPRPGTAVRSTRAAQGTSWPVQMDIDLGQFIQTMRFVSAVGKEIVFNEQTRNLIARKLVELQLNGFHEEAKDQALSPRNSIAHVYTWDEISEGSGKFEAYPNLSSPLFKIIRNSRRQGAVFSIKILENPNKAERDVRMEAAAKYPLADHHFKDQASELEQVSIIEKDSKRLSRRRISSPGKAKSRYGKLSSRRIVDLDPSGNIINRVRVRRPNEFQNNFTEFFFEFFNTKKADPINYKGLPTQLAQELGRLHAQQMNYSAQGRKGAVFSTARRAGGATKLTARLTSSPIIAFNEKGQPVGIAGFSADPKPSDMKAVKAVVNKTFKKMSTSGAIR